MKKINFSNLYKKIREAFRMKRRFIIYRKPDDNIVYLCIDNENYKKLYSNFKIIIGDFHNKNIIVINPKEIYFLKISNKIKIILNNNINYNNFQENELINYYNLIKKSLKEIQNKTLKKVVISRKKEIFFNSFDLKNTINNLLNTYFESFINIWYDPVYGLWLGATPELLFNIKNNELSSVALAGTMKINNQENYTLTWNFKALEEHYIVVNYIYNILKQYPGKIFLDKTQTLYTGLIKHLKTSIKFSFLKNIPKYEEILNLLHPTPAICGIPKDLAYKFIIDNEEYNRSFYTGYIGIINKNITEFYVNLRCANILNNFIIIYAGCGITNYSNPKNELWESEIKMHNILSNINFN